MRSTVTCVSGSGWQRGIRSCVRLAAMMPAILAAWSGSPFLTEPAPIARRAAADIRTAARAIASRAVTGLSPTSTILTRPRASTWVKTWSVLLCRLAFGLRPLSFALDTFLVLALVLVPRQVKRQALQRNRQVHALQLDAPRHAQRARCEV